MTVAEFMELFIDENSQQVSIYDLNKEKIIYNGFLPSMPDNIRNRQVWSIDNLSDDYTVTINIEGA